MRLFTEYIYENNTTQIMRKMHYIILIKTMKIQNPKVAYKMIRSLLL